MAEDNAQHGLEQRKHPDAGADADTHAGADAAKQQAQTSPDQAPETAPDSSPDDSPDNSPDASPPEISTEPPKQGPAGRIASALIVLLAILAIWLVIWQTNRYPRTDDAEVFANYIGMAPLVNGPITQVNVRDNQQVHAGETLFRIDDRPYRYALDQATSQRAALEGQIIDENRSIESQQSAALAAAARTTASQAEEQRATAGIAEAKADVTNAQAALARAKAEYAYSLNNLHRVEPLLAKQFVTVDQVDQIRTGTAAKQLGVDQAQAQLALSQARLQSSYAAQAASSSSVSEAQAQRLQSVHAVRTLDPLTAQRSGRDALIADARYNFDNCVVRAPFDARVTNLTLSEGAFAHAGEQVFTLIDTRTWWVVANFRETQLHRILPGMHVNVYLMSDPHHLYRGVVDSAGFGVTPDASTVGTLNQGLPEVQRTLSWVHLASRYPVRIRILDPLPNEFRVSESAVVEVRGWKSW
jgi:multidrug efflux system membrane fusion protein